MPTIWGRSSQHIYTKHMPATAMTRTVVIVKQSLNHFITVLVDFDLNHLHCLNYYLSCKTERALKRYGTKQLGVLSNRMLEPETLTTSFYSKSNAQFGRKDWSWQEKQFSFAIHFDAPKSMRLDADSVHVKVIA